MGARTILALQELMELRYAHLAPEHLSDAAARIERGFGIVEDDATFSLR